MRAVVLQMPEHWLAERRQTGEDRRDELWDGVVHMSPFPGRSHQRMAGALYAALRPLAEALGLEAYFELGVYEPGRGELNYRGPDLAIARPEHVSPRGIEGRAELVIEVLSPHDESREKLPFYATCGVREVWLVEPETRALEAYALADGAYARLAPDAAGVVHAPALGLALAVVAGPRLRVTWAAGAADL